MNSILDAVSISDSLNYAGVDKNSNKEYINNIL